MPWIEPANPSGSWTTTRNTVQAWQPSGAPSTESRLNAVFPLPETSAGNVDFVWRVQSFGNFVVATGNLVQIKSRITDGP